MVLPREEAISPVAPIGSERAGMQSFSSTPFDQMHSSIGRQPPTHEKSGEAQTDGPWTPPDNAARALPIAGSRAKLVFEKHETTGKIVARLVDSETGDLIRQVPPEEMLKLAEAIDSYLGLLVDRHS